MKYSNDVLQAAIDAACEETAKGPFRPMCAELALRAKDNPHEANSRLALAKAFLAALPPLTALDEPAEPVPASEALNAIPVYLTNDPKFGWVEWLPAQDTHPADILLHHEQKSDPYAEFKAAHAAGKTIQLNCGDTGEPEWEDVPDPAFLDTPDRYRIKPEPETFQSDDKVKTPRTDAVIANDKGDSGLIAELAKLSRSLEEENADLKEALEKAKEFVQSWGEIIDTHYSLWNQCMTKIQKALAS